MPTVYQNALKKLHKTNPNHPIFGFRPERQMEFMDLLREGQAYYIREGIADKVQEIALPGLGTLMYNPLRAIAEKVKAEYKDKLYPYEMDQLIKENLATYFETKGDPFVKGRAKPRKFNMNGVTNEII